MEEKRAKWFWVDTLLERLMQHELKGNMNGDDIGNLTIYTMNYAKMFETFSPH